MQLGYLARSLTQIQNSKAASNIIKKIQEIINLEISIVEIDNKIP